MQSQNDNFGLKRTRIGGIGFHYILAAAVSYVEQWANRIGLDLFEYERLTNVDKTDASQSYLWTSLNELEIPTVEWSFQG